MKRILFILVMLFAASAFANDPHKLAEGGKWHEALEALKQQNTGLKAVKNGKTLLDLAVDLEAPSDLVVLLLDLGVATAPEASEDLADTNSLSEDQLRLIEKWLAGEYATPTPDDRVEPCIDLAELEILDDEVKTAVQPVRRALVFDSLN